MYNIIAMSYVGSTFFSFPTALNAPFYDPEQQQFMSATTLCLNLSELVQLFVLGTYYFLYIIISFPSNINVTQCDLN